MNFESPSIKKEENKSEQLTFPHAESIFRLFQKEYKNEPEKAEILKNVLYEFFEEEMKNTQIYKSEKLGAAFPWTVIKTGELTKKILEKISDKNEELKKIPIREENDKQIASQEFVFTSGSLTTSGYQFTFVEKAIHEALNSLRINLGRFKNGEAIENREIYTLGLPTNKMGELPIEFLEKLKKDPFGSMGELLEEFVETRIYKNQDEKSKTNLRFYGVSTGASFAASAGGVMLKKGLATQETQGDDSDNLPKLSIRMDSAVGLSESKNKKWQIPLGYATEAIYQTFLDPKFRFEDPIFMGKVKKVLIDRGFPEHMSKEEAKLKKEAIDSIIKKLKEGVEVGPELKVTKVTGIFDPLTFSINKYFSEKRKQKNKSESLGKNLANRAKDNQREFDIKTTHTANFFTANELERYMELVDLMEGLERA